MTPDLSAPTAARADDPALTTAARPGAARFRALGGVVAALALLLVAGGPLACSKSGGPAPSQTTEEPPATASDGALVLQVPADAEAAIGKAGLRVLEESEPREVRFRAHLDVVINGHEVTVPSGIGVVDEKRASPLTTRDDSGVLHIASPEKDATFRLGHLFQQWNVPLDKDCIAGLCASANEGKQLLAFVNGELAADPSTVQLTEGSQIVVWFGDRATNPSVPTTYEFTGT
jgi:hypothetical protein